jgi:hypothetical protein
MGILGLATWQWILMVVGIIVLVAAIVLKKKGS